MTSMERSGKLEHGVNVAPPKMKADRDWVLAIRYLVMGAVERELWVALRWNTDGAI